MTTGQNKQNDLPETTPARRDSAALGFGLVVAVLIVGGVLGYTNAQRLALHSDLVAHTHEVVAASEALLSTLKDAETGQRGYLLTEEEKYLQPHDAALERIRDDLNRLQQLTSDNPEQQSRLTILDQKAAKRLDELNQTVALLKAGDRAAAMEVVRSGVGKAMMNDLRQDIAAFQQTEHDLLKRRAVEAEASYRTTIWSMFFTTLLGVVLVGVVYHLHRRNIQQQRQAALVVAEQGERLRTTLASIGDAVITTDTDGRVTNLNAVAESLTGWTTAEASGQPLDSVFHIVHEATGLPVQNPAFRALKEGFIVGLANHTILLAKNGTEWPIDDSAAPIRDGHGQVIGCVLVFREISERRKNERLIEEAHSRLASTLAAGEVGTWEFDTVHNTVWADANLARLFGVSSTEAAGGPLEAYLRAIHPDDLKRVIQIIQQALEKGDSYEADYRLVGPDQSVRWVIARGRIERDAQGQPVRLPGVVVDITGQRRAEQELRASEEQRRLALDAAEAGAWNIDPATEKLHSDERFRVIFQGSTDPISYEEAFAAIHPEDRERIREAVGAAIQVEHPAPYAEEYRVVHPDGTLRWVFGKGRAHLERTETAHRVASFDGTVTDITAWKLAEQAQRHSEARFRMLFNLIDEGFCVVEMLYGPEGKPIDYRFLEVNPAFEKHCGLTDPVGKTIRQFVPNHEDVWFKLYGEVAASGIPRRVVERSEAMGGWWWDVYAFRLGGPGSHQVAVLFNDITARVRAEEAKRKRSDQVQRLAAVLPNISAAEDIASALGVVVRECRHLIEAHQFVAIYLTENRWKLPVVFAEASDRNTVDRILSEKPDGTGLESLVCETNRPLRLTQTELEAHPASAPWNKPVPRSSGGWLAAPLVTRDGRNMGLLQLFDKLEGEFTADDEAVLAQLAQMTSIAIENARLLEDLKEADSKKDEFLAVLAHELRNPLAPIRNGLQVMKLAKANPDLIERSRSMMDRQVNQMVHLIDDLMDISRISRGKLALRRERVELTRIIQQAIETSRPLIEENNHDLVVDLPSEPILLEADVTRLAQVFSNLLNNAAKYTDRAGRIRVSASLHPSEVIVSVQDNGVGIPANMLPKVFDLFTQVDRSLEKAQGGLGIGLSLVKKLTELHSGSVEGRSEGHGQGSEFIVTLPIVPTQAHESESTDDIPGSAAAKRRILVADDNVDAASSLALLLNFLGNDVQTANDGLAAFEKAMAFQPEIALLDIGMPKLSGLDVCRRIRQQPWGRKIVLIALTGWGQEDDRRQTAEVGFDHHLVKPIDPAILQKLLAELKPKTV